MSNPLRLETVDLFTQKIPRQGPMQVEATLFTGPALRVEADAIRQLAETAEIDPQAVVLATPDIHTGYGVPIGSVFASPQFISPSAVGYDINCGMRLLCTPFEKKGFDPLPLAEEIARSIPLGEGKQNIKLTNQQLLRIVDRGLKNMPRLAEVLDLTDEEQAHLHVNQSRVEDNGSLDGSAQALPPRALERGMPQLGTLGGGNHFIEIQEIVEIFSDQARSLGMHKGQITIMIHSGSRGLGHETAGYYIKKARQSMHAQGLQPPNGQLVYFSRSERQGREYLRAMNAAANYAFANREILNLLICRAAAKVYGPTCGRLATVYDVSHNMAKVERYDNSSYIVHRKGATRAFEARLMTGTPFSETGQPVLIPGSMGSASYVLLGCPGARKSLYSVNHGAGRVMSRTQAAGKRGKPGQISDADFRKSMAGITLICGNKRRIKEEAPAAYKNIDRVIEAVTGAGLAIPAAKMKPLAVLKG